MNSKYLIMEALSVRELSAQDIPKITEYWLGASPEHLLGMGVDLSKLPSREEWEAMLSEQLSQPYAEKKSFCIIWESGGQAVGHCNINKIQFRKEAYMHLHLWRSEFRQKGLGQKLARLTLPHFFEQYQLEILYCEPYAHNPAPNKTLGKIGFRFLKTHVTTPGWINFEQEVNLWGLDRERYLLLP